MMHYICQVSVVNGSARRKVPDGKMLSVKIEYDTVIKKIELSGDFFIHPEEGITDIEDALIGSNPFNEKEICAIISSAVSLNHIELIGLTPDNIAKTISMAIR